MQLKQIRLPGTEERGSYGDHNLTSFLHQASCGQQIIDLRYHLVYAGRFSISPFSVFNQRCPFFFFLTRLSISTAITIVTVINPISIHSSAVSGTVLNTHWRAGT